MGTLLQLKSMPALKALFLYSIKDEHAEGIENLKQQLRHISINENEDSFYYMASPGEENLVMGIDWNDPNLDNDLIWDIIADNQDLFAKVDIDNDESDDSDDSNDSDDE